MITIQNKYRADYLVTDEPIKLTAMTLISRQGISLEPGMKISRIGKANRTSFEMMEGMYMIYEGILKWEGLTYAIFNCPEHNLPNAPFQYRYAFTCCVSDFDGKLLCFLIGEGGPKGCRDVILDNIELFSPPHPLDKKEKEITKIEKSAGKNCSFAPTLQQTKNSPYL